MEYDPLMQWFEFDHLPPFLRLVSSDFRELARKLDRELPLCEERSVALRKLLEAKDCAVRAAIFESKRRGE